VGFLSGKRALITGIASQRSIAWGIAEAMHKHGANLAFSYQTERLKERVDDAAQQFGGGPVIPCDVANEGDIERMFAQLSESWDSVDIVVHAIAFAPREQLQGRFVDAVTRDGFKIAHEISAYSFAEMAKASRPLMANRAGALLTLSYLGAVRALPNYNVMGLAKASLEAAVRFLAQDLGPEGTRVNAISAGPIKTLAAAGVGNLRKMLDHVEKTSPIRRNVTIEDVGNAAAFLCSDLAAGVTGEILYVDGGYSHVSMSELAT
jgi:enoyl-[acyl-carrier protein] reductase I